MTKKFRTIKASIVMSVLLVSIFAAFTPISSARLFLNLSSYVNVNLGGTNLSEIKPIVPLGDSQELTVYVTYGVTRGGVFSQGIFTLLHEGRQVNIKLEITDKSDWCTATLQSGTLTTQTSSEEKSLSTKLTIRVDENAPAYGAGYITITATVPRIGLIDEFSQAFTLEFTPGYLPMISATLPDGNSKTIGPLDTATFPIKIENMGNARTTVTFTIDNVPDGWIAVVTNDITLDEGQGSTGTVYLTIKPPKGFGYHNDDQSITVTMIPARAEDLRNVGESKTVSVIVESRGFSTPGFEPILFIGAFLVVVLLLKWKKKK